MKNEIIRYIRQFLGPRTPAGQRAAAPKLGLALGGGAARGFAHVGVIRVLEQEKIPVDVIAGTSVGSLIGAMYASELNSFELEWTAFTLEKDDLLDFGVRSVFTGMGVVMGDRLEEFVRSKVRVADIEDLKLPFAAVATDLNRGDRVVLDRGPVSKAVRASSSIPGIFPPLDYRDMLLVDGGLVENIPIAAARDMGADIVIAVDISRNVTNFDITNLVDVVLQSGNIVFSQNVNYTKKEADILITPAVDDVTMFDFTRKKQCMEAGIGATRKAVPGIRKAIEAWRMGTYGPGRKIPGVSAGRELRTALTANREES